ncbi:terminase small subunit [Aneurinibacillus aneurinilyticus]|uniref:terminase small subunit n=1 Tax=Aneurinibacillus aneurinilyticus TaxID=1391 RepID=UPI002E21A389|nr:terminase small subunit [Aneurinibacillus aneurinilyticus]
MSKLTPKQQAFADYYIETGNATEAARKAGYKGNNLNRVASENLTKLVIKNYIAERMAQKDNERVASQDEILEFLTKVMRGELTEQIPVGKGEGFFTLDDKDTYVKDRVKAAELLGKRYVMWTDRQQVEGNVGVTIVDDIGDDGE